MKETIKRISFAIVMAIALLSFSDASMASDNAAKAEGYMKTIINQEYDSTDLAHRSLVRLFGGFIFEPFGNAPNDPPTALAKVLGYTNVIAMILGVIIMGYVILAGALNTAASGEMLGKSWSSVWLPLRTSFAFGMVMPASAGGETFSVAQSLVIWMIIVGSNSATWLWEKGADALITGSPIMPTTVYRLSEAEKTIIDTVFCSAARDHMMRKRDNGKESYIGHVAFNKPTGNDKFLSNLKQFKYSEINSLDLSAATKIVFNKCGEIVIPNADGSHSEINDVMSGTTYENGRGWLSGNREQWELQTQQRFYTSIRKNIGKLLTTSAAYSDRVIALELNGKKIESRKNGGANHADDLVIEAVRLAAEDYANFKVEYGNYVETVRKESLSGSVDTKSWKSRITEGGWMKAGAWFFETSRFQGFVQTLLGTINSSNKYYGLDNEFSSCFFTLNFSGCNERNEEFRSWLEANITIAEESLNINQNSTTPGTISIANSSTGVDADAIDSISVSVAQFFLDYLMGLGEDSGGTGGNVTANGENNMSGNVSGMISPFTAVSGLGRGLQQIAFIIWSGGLIVAGIVGFNNSGLGVVTGVVTGSKFPVIVAISQYIMSSLTPIMIGIGGLAFMLAFALPFMPITIWIMLVCGYLVTVIEAVAAAPLAVIMLATPEGEGISGTSFKHALQMINAIILRPSLSIVGLFAAMTLAYAAFALLNELFWTVAGLATNVSIFEILALVFIYATLAFKVCEYMISVIHKIPDQIMEWMGGGMARPFGEDAAGGDMTGALKANTAASGVSGLSGMKTAGDIMSKRLDNAKAENEANRHGQMVGAMGDGKRS